jgi:hypothetical protein
MFFTGRDAKKVGGTAEVFCFAGEVDPKPVRFESRAVRMDDQSLPGLRICMQVLLRTVHA